MTSENNLTKITNWTEDFQILGVVKREKHVSRKRVVIFDKIRIKNVPIELLYKNNFVCLKVVPPREF